MERVAPDPNRARSQSDPSADDLADTSADQAYALLCCFRLGEMLVKNGGRR